MRNLYSDSVSDEDISKEIDLIFHRLIAYFKTGRFKQMAGTVIRSEYGPNLLGGDNIITKYFLVEHLYREMLPSAYSINVVSKTNNVYRVRLNEDMLDKLKALIAMREL